MLTSHPDLFHVSLREIVCSFYTGRRVSAERTEVYMVI